MCAQSWVNRVQMPAARALCLSQAPALQMPTAAVRCKSGFDMGGIEILSRARIPPGSDILQRIPALSGAESDVAQAAIAQVEAEGRERTRLNFTAQKVNFRSFSDARSFVLSPFFKMQLYTAGHTTVLHFAPEASPPPPPRLRSRPQMTNRVAVNSVSAPLSLQSNAKTGRGLLRRCHCSRMQKLGAVYCAAVIEVECKNWARFTAPLSLQSNAKTGRGLLRRCHCSRMQKLGAVYCALAANAALA
jgi:hypothetical protein